MKTAIIYYSEHHNNTKKVIDRIASEYEITLFDATVTRKADLSQFDMIGFASGIYYGKFHDSVMHVAKTSLPKGKKVFFLYTCGTKRANYTTDIKALAENKKAEIIGSWGCTGHDTYGPFKLIGGIAKGHPTENELQDAVKFFRRISGEQ